MNIPKPEEIAAMLYEQGTPANILDHMNVVRDIAVLLAKKLNEKNIKVDVEAVEAGALLHDMCKLSNRGDHEEAAAAMLKERGYPEVAEIVRLHGGHHLQDLKTWEEKLVSYADKRVMHDKIVGVHERNADTIERYPQYAEQLAEHEKLAMDIEKEIFASLDITPDQVKDELLKEATTS